MCQIYVVFWLEYLLEFFEYLGYSKPLVVVKNVSKLN